MSEEIIIPVMIGLGLSASTGFRIFIPFLVLSILSLFGYVSLSDEFGWIATYPALIAFSAAAIFEIGGYFIPLVDNTLDTIATPLAAIAGVIIMASVITDFSPLLKWSLAIIAGGGLAGTIQAATGILRLGSTSTTGGIANPVISTAEAGISFGLSALSIFLPVISFFAIVLFLVWIIKKYGKWRLSIFK